MLPPKQSGAYIRALAVSALLNSIAFTEKFV
jgi:hypothetical protein